MLPVRKVLALQTFEGGPRSHIFSFFSILLKTLAFWESGGSFVEENYIRMYSRNASLVLSKVEKGRYPRKR